MIMRILMFASSSAFSPVQPRRLKAVTMTFPSFSVCVYKVRENPKCGRVRTSAHVVGVPVDVGQERLGEHSNILTAQYYRA
ncbi:hypothetical protein EDB89DRAFT_1981957, partial [Lactarius sanguifluus]